MSCSIWLILHVAIQSVCIMPSAAALVSGVINVRLLVLDICVVKYGTQINKPDLLTRRQALQHYERTKDAGSVHAVTDLA